MTENTINAHWQAYQEEQISRDAFFPHLSNYIHRRAEDEDAAQEALLRIHQHLEECHGALISPWLNTILKREQHRQQTKDHRHSAAVITSLELDQLLQRDDPFNSRALHTLPADLQDAAACLLNQMSLEQTSQLLGLTTSALRRRFQRYVAKQNNRS